MHSGYAIDVALKGRQLCCRSHLPILWAKSLLMIAQACTSCLYTTMGTAEMRAQVVVCASCPARHRRSSHKHSLPPDEDSILICQYSAVLIERQW